MSERFSLEDLAHRAGVPMTEVRRLAELGLLIADDDGRFGVGDVRRVRIVHACDEAGMPADAIAEAVRAGRLSLAFLDLETFRWAERSSMTYAELARAHGVSVELVLEAHEALGVVRPGTDDVALDEDVELAPVLAAARGADIPDEAILRTLRVYAESLRRIAAAETDVYHDYVEVPLLRSGLGQREMMDAASVAGSEVVRRLDGALMAVYRRQQEHTWLEDLIEHVESALEEAGVRERAAALPAMCFLDISGYTELTEERGDAAAAKLATTLAQIVQRVSGSHGGRVVKRLGDGIMFHFREPARSVVAALEMVTLLPQVALPPAHVGIAAGPVVSEDGDYFGRTVNLAARIADRAAAGEVLVTDEVMERSRDTDVVFREVEPVRLKGFAEPVRLHAAIRA